MAKWTPENFIAAKGVDKIPMLTAYSYPIAQCFENAGIPIILVGDSLAMVELGLDSTRDVTTDDIAYHLRAVRRGAANTHIVADMPYKTYDTIDDALACAKTLIASGADSVKLEGGGIEIIRALREEGYNVVSHVGLLPQTAKSFKQVGKTGSEAQVIEEMAKETQDAGAFMIVLEHIPSDLAKRITKALTIPTIGIGAGECCDGQVLVANDMLGLGGYWPPFSKQFAHLNNTITDAAKAYLNDVKSGEFPQSPHIKKV